MEEELLPPGTGSSCSTISTTPNMMQANTVLCAVPDVPPALPLLTPYSTHYQPTLPLVNNFYIQVGHENGKEAVTGGFFGNLFRTLIELTNSTYTLSVLPGYSYGHRRPNSTEWSGLIGVLQRREADISACEVTIGLDRIDALSFAQPVRNAGCRFYFQKQFQEMMFKPYLQPFDGRVWIALLVYVIATGILKWFFHYLLRERADPITATFAIVAALLNQASGDSRRCAIRVLYFWICALFLILRIGYGARLTATSTLRQSTLPYHGMEDILASDWSVNIISNSFALESMQMSPSNSTARKLWQTKIDNNPDSMVQTVEDGLKNVLDQKNLAFLGFEDSCREVLHSRFSPDQSCKISELDGVFFKAPLSFALPRDSEFLVTINYWILKLFESGIIDRLSRKWLPKPSVCDDNKWYCPRYRGRTFWQPDGLLQTSHWWSRVNTFSVWHGGSQELRGVMYRPPRWARRTPE
ncbi:probable glutamate receptor [Schistocerca americana]|uniref:probable glutamate receptor n=1 Tax=Schistocerca americana TaxID=7009 RepID=UPI001F4F3583|nr:probable glutamate receptor [Schistocerca americana]